MARFTSKLTIVLGLCAALALARAAGHAAVDTRPEVICNDGACYPRVFRPTTEFQEVLEGQEIPGGLHVQMDFETHKKFAKLMDPESVNEKDATNSILVVDKDSPGTFKHQVGSDSGDLINMPSPIDLQHPDGESNQDFAQFEADSQKNLQAVFDSIPELAHLKDQPQAQQRQKTPPVPPITRQGGDHQFFTEQLDIVKTSTDNTDVLAALEELTDLASDMDFGLQLSGGEGLLALVKHMHCNEKTQAECEQDSLLRSKSATIIGTAVQNHEKAQNAAFQAGLHKYLITRLERESDQQVLRRLATAYGSLVRGSRNEFFQVEDIVRLGQLYSKSNDPTFKRKVIYIMSDFADPDMQYLSTSDNDTTTAEEDGHNESSNSTKESMTVVEKSNVNVGPWCESLQHELLGGEHGSQVNDGHEDWEIIHHALDMLHKSYPETCQIFYDKRRIEL
ncbi:hypothetical protein BGX27_008025 [Mortierella sp. AM989]|nr:hypothetical protein BGX27_008025 [Mortierella sp. AM989]